MKRFMSRREHEPSFDAVALAYARVLQIAIVEAAALRWSVSGDHLSSVHLDSSGLFVVIGGALKRVLPAVADLGFAGWRSMRAQRGHAPMMPPLP